MDDLPRLRVVVRRGSDSNPLPARTIVLEPITWDDWFKYSTLYHASVVDESGELLELGRVKIAVAGMPRERKHPLPAGSTYTDEIPGVYSLGQSEEYYFTLAELGEELRRSYTVTLGDIVAHPDVQSRHGDDDVLSDSLLRFVSTASARGEFSRILAGAVALTKFNVTYRDRDLELEFLVDPDSMPRTNIHAIIGRNGVGKTHILREISRALLFDRRGPKSPSLQAFDEDGMDEGVFAGVALVTFSPFDTFMPPRSWSNRKGVKFDYIGLRYWFLKEESGDWVVRYYTPGTLWRPLLSAISAISAHERSDLWISTLDILRSDPIFDDLNFETLIEGTEEDQKTVFNDLSDGHKTVLLAVTRLAASVEERTLVVMDEPEAHLHPPLLSAFTRALSFMLRRRNAVAILATHSPVILQELPRECVTLLDRSVGIVSARRPDIETYGEDVATLTHEVFHLEVAKSGYHRDLAQLASEGLTYSQAVSRLSGLGLEGRSILRALSRRNET